MAYSTSNPPFLLARGIAGGMAGSTAANSTAFTGYVTMWGGGNQWYYRSSDPVATVVASSYFTNGMQLGMRLGDVVTIVDMGQGSSMFLSLSVVSAVTTGTTTVGGVTLTTGNLGSTI